MLYIYYRNIVVVSLQKCRNIENKTGGALVYMQLFLAGGGGGGGGQHFTPKFIMPEKYDNR